MKVASFNFFRVSVDYVLAFVVTVNSLVSGYITASIVAFHSVAQVFNDMWWDNYIANQTANSADRVDFVHIGARNGGVRSEERRVGKSVSVRVYLGGRRIIKKKKTQVRDKEKTR